MWPIAMQACGMVRFLSPFSRISTVPFLLMPIYVHARHDDELIYEHERLIKRMFYAYQGTAAILKA